MLVIAASMLALGERAAGQMDYTLDDFDRWKPSEAPSPVDEQLQQARIALANGDASRALNLSENFLENNPLGQGRSDAFLIQGDAQLALGYEYKALFCYEDVARRYAMSAAFIPALEREFEIAKAYAHGLKKRFMGTFRWIDAGDDAQEILIRIQERLPGSELAEKAGMELSDYYFRIRDMPLAADSYDLFVQNYPRSKQVNKAKLRLIYSYYAQFKGPQYDASGLREATSRLKQLQADDPALAQQIGAEALLVRVYESEAAKLLHNARWYESMGDFISTELTLRSLVKLYPKSIATITALKMAPGIVAKLPEGIAKNCPNYAELEDALIGTPKTGAFSEPTGVLPNPEAPLPDTAQTADEKPVAGAELPPEDQIKPAPQPVPQGATGTPTAPPPNPTPPQHT
ncbi:MAG: outer membrane protein assembly factor BamD [Planctomycetes bacterium]|nr:outer membrane protein assembly factor BamD [Planctomycetota bacterium]